MNQAPPTETQTRLPHLVGRLLFATTFPLIFLGGLVTTYQAGMAVPDWPGTYGYNLFLYPWSTWLFGPWDLLIEHGHRLLGAMAGVVSIFLLVLCWMRPVGRELRLMSLALLVGVIGQGLLGGLRVLWDARQVAQIHGCVGPLFLALVACFLVLSGRQRTQLGVALTGQDDAVARGASIWSGWLFTLSVLQLLLGSFLRHQPPGMGWRDFQLFVVFHLFVAMVLVVVCCTLPWRLAHAATLGHAHRLSWLLVGLVFCQIALGLGTWLANYGWPDGLAGRDLAANWLLVSESMAQSLVTTSHQAMGALFVAGAAAVWTSCLLAGRPAEAVVGSHDQARGSVNIEGTLLTAVATALHSSGGNS